jgi:hypothetical protein
MARVRLADVLKFMVAPIFLVLGVAIFAGQLWLVFASFGALVVTMRAQRREEIKRLHGYRRRRGVKRDYKTR